MRSARLDVGEEVLRTASNIIATDLDDNPTRQYLHPGPRRCHLTAKQVLEPFGLFCFWPIITLSIDCFFLKWKLQSMVWYRRQN